MGSPADLLRPVAPSVEAQVQSRLSGFLGGIVRGYLPQAWVFRTDGGVATLVVDRDGRVQVLPEAVPEPDVTIELSLERLRAALAQRSPPTGPPGAVKVTPHTPKGRTAFDFARSRLGL